MLAGELARGLLQLGRAHVVGRYVDEIATKRHSFGDAGEILAVNALGQHQPHIARVALAVTGELIGAERKGKRREPFVMRRIGKAVKAGRQQIHQLPRAKRVLDPFIGGFDAEQRAGNLAVRRRHDEMAARLGLEAGRAQKDTLAVVDDFDRFVEGGGIDEENRYRRRPVGLGKNRMHGHSAVSRKGGLAA